MYVGYRTSHDKTVRKVNFLTSEGKIRYGKYNPSVNHPLRLRELFEEMEI
jgi:hypothetical protein